MPESLHTFFRADGRIAGYLVIDSTLNGLSAGGIRMVPNMSLTELCYLARAMTFKYSFLKWPFGGAKAAIITHREDLSPQQRRECVELFAGRLAAFRGRYLPGQDVGTTSADLELIRRVARLDREHAAPDSGFHTAMTVRICIEKIAAERRLDLAGCTVAIEGLGKVGGWVARQLGELGCRVVAVSTAKGAIHDPNGLDIGRLTEARAACGDECVNRYAGARKLDGGELLTLPVDFLIPCALSWSIRQANVEQVQARAVVCGANNPVTDKAKQALAARDILYFPDFVSNCGGVLGSIIEILCMDRARAVDILRQQFEPKVESIFARSKGTGRSLEASAREIAEANREQMKQREGAPKGRLARLAEAAFRHGLLPGALVKAFAPAYIRKTMA